MPSVYNTSMAVLLNIWSRYMMITFAKIKLTNELTKHHEE